MECLVVNCNERSGNDFNSVIFYRLPEDDEERKKWLMKCGREVTCDGSQSVVCSRHFTSDDFEILKDNSSALSLKKGVVPHLNVLEVKQEPLDSDEYEGQLSPPTTNPSLNTVIIKNEVDDSFFENSIAKENQPDETSEAIPVELIQVNSTVPVTNSVSSSSAAYAPSSLPASQNWSGLYDFTVSFGPQQKTTKGVSWTYSKLKDKLYVGKDAPCPINFSAKVGETDGIIIRATALYSSPEHASEVVHRCVNHSMIEASKGVFEAEHLVRCESQRATYEQDNTTKRHSVIVPFENPPAGQLYSTYLYKFTCFGSCAGGPNRRPLMLIFSLEKGGKVVGRRKLDVKICACPGRDRKAEEQQLIEGHPQLPLKRKEQELTSLADTLQFTKNIYLPATKKLKPNKNSPYVLSVSDKECYEFLKHMKKFFEMCKTVNNLPPSIKNVLMNPGRYKSNKKNGADNEESDSDQ
ncbi:Cellular tumor antigen p53 like protein [Argiope bruennichi]|uniref:Cellular tumor antigen p53 like protein n=1 Tax=Argiope bruennichi TaxID=94029 RepID=A0A8T0FTA0_ARGBR|nr:Cellular tumor antigen p53 like protein [Argiope bruennichi]